MYKYSTNVTLNNPNQDDELLKCWQKLLKETQELHTDNPLTEAEIIAEINTIRLIIDNGQGIMDNE